MIFETYSARLRNANKAGQPDVYTYDNPSDFMRRQIAMAVEEGIGSASKAYPYWEFVNRTCVKEIASYAEIMPSKLPLLRVTNALATLASSEDFLDILEISVFGLLAISPDLSNIVRGAEATPQDAIDEINGRFRQHAFGYQIESGFLIRVDSQFSHAEIIKPTIGLLTESFYSKASKDFLIAHQHYRTGSYKDCVTAANRAFESTMKAICDREGWQYRSGDTAGRLVTIVSQQGLFTHDFENGLNAFIAMLKTGLPAIRNDAGAHGEGFAAEAVTMEIAHYALNMSATNILFLAECYKSMKSRRLS